MLKIHNSLMINLICSYFSVNYPQCLERTRLIQLLTNTKKETPSTQYQGVEMEW